MPNVIRDPCDEGIILSQKTALPCSEKQSRWILAATILASSMAFIDSTVVNVALPALQKNLQATAIGVQWVVEAYALFLSALLLVGGSLGDHYGRRRIFLMGVSVFALASMWCGLAPNIEQLIAARAVQGVGGALLIPGSLAIISASFPPEKRGRAIGTWSGFLPGVIVLGLGMATSVAPLTTTIMSSVSEEQAGVASGINNAVSRVGGLLAIAVLGVIMLQVYSRELDRRLSSLNIPEATRTALYEQRIKLAGVDIDEVVKRSSGGSSTDAESTRQAFQQVVRESFVSAFRVVMFICATMAFAGAVVAFLVIENNH